jgi:hypothetical protein
MALGLEVRAVDAGFQWTGELNAASEIVTLPCIDWIDKAQLLAIHVFRCMLPPTTPTQLRCSRDC